MSKCYSLIVFLALVVYSLAKNPLVVRECGNIPEDKKVLSLNSYAANPDVIPIPGNFNLSFNIDLNRDLAGGEIDLEVWLRKYTAALFSYVPIPCLRRVGSCTYDLCTLLNSAFQDWCPKVMVENNIPCNCQDLKAGTYTMNNQFVDVPRLGPLFNWLAKGDYKVELKLRDRATGKDVGCLYVEASVRDPTACTGWGCSIRGLFGGR